MSRLPRQYSSRVVIWTHKRIRQDEAEVAVEVSESSTLEGAGEVIGMCEPVRW